MPALSTSTLPIPDTGLRVTVLELLPESAGLAVVAAPDPGVVPALGLLLLPPLPQAAIAKAAAIGIATATSRFMCTSFEGKPASF
jgi:hypothetical protein